MSRVEVVVRLQRQGTREIAPLRMVRARYPQIDWDE
jgi:hypothetical protein